MEVHTEHTDNEDLWLADYSNSNISSDSATINSWTVINEPQCYLIYVYINIILLSCWQYIIMTVQNINVYIIH